MRPGDGAAGGGGWGDVDAEVRLDSSGRRRKRLTFAMEEYRWVSNYVCPHVCVVGEWFLTVVVFCCFFSVETLCSSSFSAVSFFVLVEVL